MKVEIGAFEISFDFESREVFIYGESLENEEVDRIKISDAIVRQLELDNVCSGADEGYVIEAEKVDLEELKKTYDLLGSLINSIEVL